MSDSSLLEKSDALKKIRTYFEVLQDNMESYPFVTDLKTGIVMLSKRMVEKFDLPDWILENMDSVWLPLIYFEDQAAYEEDMRELFALRKKTKHRLEYRVRNKTGEFTWILCEASVKLDDEGNPAFFAGVITPMDRVLHADPVTGLLNRFAFDQELEETMVKAMEDGSSGAVMIIGLDNFHLLTDNFNQDVGDAAMREIGRSIENVLPTHLHLYKLDGPEFALIWPDTSPEEVAIIFSGVQICLREMKEMNEAVLFSASAGVVFYPDSGTNALGLSRYAHAALKMARERGREQLSFFSQEEYQKWLQFVNLQRSFEDSIEKGCLGFHLYYQVQVDAKTQKIVGAEALLRWEEPTGEIISPIVFIPILERTRLIIPVGRWVVWEAARTCKKWQEYCPGFEMSVNVSLCQLENYDFQASVQEILDEVGLNPRFLTLELTESQSVSNWDFVNDQFDKFRQMGVRVAMDDFGVGNSSLSLLKNFNCDVVKVDKVFVDDILVSDFDRKLVKLTVGLCQSIGMSVCIEGVEEKEAYEYLTNECNADIIQGFYFGRPEPQQVFEQRFRQAPGA